MRWLLALVLLAGGQTINRVPALVAPISTLPMGVPDPPFGINETAGATTVTKVQGDTVSGTLAAGTVMSVTGTFANVSINANNCSVSQPCFIVGGTYTGTLAVTAGHYLIFHNIRAYNPDLTGDHLVIRYSEIVGDAAGGGIFMNANNVVVHHTLLHDVGQLSTATDVDRHCIPINNNTHHVWILWNVFTRCGGDGVQVNAGLGNQAVIHHIYIGGNLATNNRQTGFWAKQSSDVVISQNFVWHMRPTTDGSGAGDCVGSQYGSARLVILNNRLWDCNYGVNLRSSDAGVNTQTMVAGNVMFNMVHQSAQEATSNPSADGTCIMVRTSGSTGGVVSLHNTCDGPHGGIQLPSGPNDVTNAWNILANFSVVGILREGTNTTTNFATLFYPTASYSGTSGSLDVVGDPQFLNLSNHDYRLAPTSPGKSLGIDDTLNVAYQSLTGSSYTSVHGVALPNLGSQPDLGAFTDLFLRGN